MTGETRSCTEVCNPQCPADDGTVLLQAVAISRLHSIIVTPLSLFTCTTF